jgi:hypothetical protein
VTLLALGACRPREAPPEPLLAEVKKALAERDRRLASYHLVAESTERGASARHEFWFRAPNRSRGDLLAPEHLTVAFDGTRLFKVSHADKRFLVYDFELPPAKAAYVLASTFQPFAPEGFRTPMLPGHGVTVKRATHPRAAEAVEVVVEAGDGVTVSWVLRMPAGDLLEKRTSDGAARTVLAMEEERCEGGLCVPKVLGTTVDGVRIGAVMMTTIELGAPLPADAFTLEAPAGYAREQHTLVEE